MTFYDKPSAFISFGVTVLRRGEGSILKDIRLWVRWATKAGPRSTSIFPEDVIQMSDAVLDSGLVS